MRFKIFVCMWFLIVLVTFLNFPVSVVIHTSWGRWVCASTNGPMVVYSDLNGPDKVLTRIPVISTSGITAGATICVYVDGTDTFVRTLPVWYVLLWGLPKK